MHTLEPVDRFPTPYQYSGNRVDIARNVVKTVSKRAEVTGDARVPNSVSIENGFFGNGCYLAFPGTGLDARKNRSI